MSKEEWQEIQELAYDNIEETAAMAVGREAFRIALEKMNYMSKETIKRDKNGRFAKKAGKVEVEMNVEPKPEKDLSDLICVSRGEYEQLKLERDAFKATAEKVSSMYLNKCAGWANEKVALLDVISTAYMHIGWFRNKLPFFTKIRNRDKIIDMEMEMDRLMSKAEGLDRE